MLRNTFCHVPGIGEITERKLWSSGIDSWHACSHSDAICSLSLKRKASILRHIEESEMHLEGGNARYFAGRLPASLHWRLFPEFRDSVAYLDIETTGLDTWDNAITTIAIYDGRSVSYYVNGENLDRFEIDIEKYQVLVTYNGKCFDVPFIEWFFRTRLDHVHIDLRFVLKSLGYSGGLKGCEQQLGLDRGDLKGVDGFFAVCLWNEYQQTGDPRALETLLAYNIEDVVNLEPLMVMAYNMKLRGTPFEATKRLAMPDRPEIPFRSDPALVERLKDRIHSSGIYFHGE